MALTKAENRMGRWGAVSYIVGNIVGSGIFIVPGTILHQTQSVGLSLAVWLLSAAIATLGAFCYVELGTSIRRSGGDFAYLCHVKWNAIAFMFMSVGCLLIYPLMLAIQAETFAEYALQFLNVWICLDSPLALLLLRKFLMFLVLWPLCFLNFFSTRRVGARFQIGSSIAKLLATGFIVCTAGYLLIFKGQSQNFDAPFANSNFAPGALVNAFFAGLFSYDGWDVLNFGAEEVDNPRFTMRFAIIVGMSCVTALYAAINISYFVVLDVATIKGSTAVAMTFAQHSMGSLQHLMPFLINIVMIGALNGSIFTASRYLFAAARHRQVPSFIALLNGHHDSPRAAVFTHIILGFAISFTGNTEQLINYLGFAQWLQRGFTMCALLWIRLGPVRHSLHPDSIRTPLIMPITFLCVCFSLVAVTLAKDFATAKFGLAILAASFIVYLLFIGEHSLNRFGTYRNISSAINDRLARIAQIGLNGQIELDNKHGDNMHYNINVVDDEQLVGQMDHSQHKNQRQRRRIFPSEADVGGGGSERRREEGRKRMNANGIVNNNNS